MTKRYVQWEHHVTFSGEIEWDDDRSPEDVIAELGGIHEEVLDEWTEIITLEHTLEREVDSPQPDNS